MRVIQNPGTVIKARSAPGENGRHGVEFKIICFIKHVWETWKYRVGAFVATSYFIPRIPDLRLHAAPLYLSLKRLLCLLVHIWKLSRLDNEYSLSFLMVEDTALWHAISEDQNSWRFRRILDLGWYPGFIQMRGCGMGVGSSFLLPPLWGLHHHGPHLGVLKHTPLFSRSSGGQSSSSWQTYLSLSCYSWQRWCALVFRDPSTSS